MSLFLGVDVGASKTQALLMNEQGQVLGMGHAKGNGNYQIVGLNNAIAVVEAAVRQALAGRTPNAACFCMAGADLPYDFAQLSAGLAPFDFPFIIYNDLMSVFRAGSRFPYGVGVICGTGFNAGGLGKDRREFRLPALGQFTGDRAGGWYIGMEAVGSAFRAWDGRGEPTLLVDAVLNALNAPNMDALAEQYVRHQIVEEDVVTLAPMVFDLSEAGDMVAQRIIDTQGKELGTAAVAVARQLELTNDEFDVVLGGSVVYGKGDRLLNAVKEIVYPAVPLAHIRRLDVAPVAGAVLLAMDSLNVTMSGPLALPDALRRQD
jgi:N-acetylglucosamine kinase-like BadF-type ATPase